MSQYDYQYDGDFGRNIGGQIAAGTRYRYTAQDIQISAESLVIKCGSVFCYSHYYSRTPLKDE